MTNEIWKTVRGFGGHYEASNLGNIRVKGRIVKKPIHGVEALQYYKGRLLKQFNNATGYKIVRFGFDNKKCTSQVGRLVLLAFVGYPKNDELCCHNDSNPANNRIENLRWGTQKDNMKDRMARGKYFSGEKHFMAKLTTAQALEIYNSEELGIDLGKKFDISSAKISEIRRGKTWKKITGGIDKGSRRKYYPRKNSARSKA